MDEVKASAAATTLWHSGVHVVPIEDVVAHDSASLDCVCGPDVEWIDPETGATCPSGPLVVHHSLDGREEHEPDAS